MQQQYVIIVAGGSGSRMKSELPKQFIEIDGVPVIVRSIRCFLNYNPRIQIIISVHPGYQSHLQIILSQYQLAQSSHIIIVHGGETRFHSVKNGLNAIQELDGVVGIHDAARPFVSQKTIARCFATAAEKGNAIPCIAVNESMRKVIGEANVAVSRSDYRVIQTPQCFLISKIKSAFEQEYNLFFTDDATVLESTGETIVLVEGNEENIKITSPHDLMIANALTKL